MARRGEPRHHVAPLVPGLGPAVQEHDGRPLAEAGSGGGVVERHLAEIGKVMLELEIIHGPDPLLTP